ncbi:hypothetical protein [Vreelandella alkaliphila]|uniref:Uncharacterized protein n=1 Tax=Vreelandella alkaliphila TaxID=272774 RepID=A0AAJ2S576_9GAMM|nr:hypothetical protein [Halomonas alkaliphila]MDX5979595.1 hypothetical protein [Halomonas alkaliphila]
MSTQACPATGRTLSLCPPMLAVQQALGQAACGVGGEAVAVAASDTGSDEAGFYPAWRSSASTIVAMTRKPLPTVGAARRFMRETIEYQVAKIMQEIA